MEVSWAGTTLRTANLEPRGKMCPNIVHHNSRNKQLFLAKRAGSYAAKWSDRRWKGKPRCELDGLQNGTNLRKSCKNLPDTLISSQIMANHGGVAFGSLLARSYS